MRELKRRVFTGVASEAVHLSQKTGRSSRLEGGMLTAGGVLYVGAQFSNSSQAVRCGSMECSTAIQPLQDSTFASSKQQRCCAETNSVPAPGSGVVLQGVDIHLRVHVWALTGRYDLANPIGLSCSASA